MSTPCLQLPRPLTSRRLFPPLIRENTLIKQKLDCAGAISLLFSQFGGSGNTSATTLIFHPEPLNRKAAVQDYRPERFCHDNFLSHITCKRWKGRVGSFLDLFKTWDSSLQQFYSSNPQMRFQNKNQTM